MTEEGLYELGLFQVLKFLLVLARVGGIFTSAPVFGDVHVPPRVRVGLAVALTFVFFPLVKCETYPQEVLPFFSLLVREAGIGLVIGFVVAMVFSAIRVAGAYVDLILGFGFANLVDPSFKENSAVVGQLQNLVATLLFLVTNGHHSVIKGLADSFAVIPVGEKVLLGSTVPAVTAVFAAMFGSALRIALPVVGAIFLTDVSLGILARTVPQLNVFVVGFPAKLAVALFVLAVSLPFFSGVMSHLIGGLERDIALVLKNLAM
ncbi:MAG: flagellar biosynthetic protein FliR [Armatimonadota bacterium]|nr:flagellar biosynthetic protein FliR [Armatimonadota bacterium]